MYLCKIILNLGKQLQVDVLKNLYFALVVISLSRAEPFEQFLYLTVNICVKLFQFKASGVRGVVEQRKLYS